ITDVAWTTDAQGAFVTFQPQWSAYTGQTWQELRGFGWANALHPEDRALVRAVWEKACEARTLYESHGRLWHAPSKQYRYFIGRATPVLNTDGSVREWVGSCTDVDEQKQAEEERERLLIREQQARREAEEASRLKDEFLALVSHELRTPLNAVLGWAHMLRVGQLGGERAMLAVETIERNARAQNQLIDDLLDVSRIITGKLRLEVRPIDPSICIAGAIESLRPAAEAKGVHVQSVLDTTVGAIAGDANRLQQVVWNLLSNAIKFTPRGGRVHVRLERVDSHIEIVVSDSGAGIKPEFLPFVFDRFR